jgi:hypothetical protein
VSYCYSVKLIEIERQYLKNLEITLKKKKNVNSTYLTKTKYDELISEVKQQVKN